MPVYGLEYRSYDGKPTRLFRWLPVMRHELRVFFTMRNVALVLLVSQPVFLIFLLSIIAHNILQSNPRSQLAVMLKGVSLIYVSDDTFWRFLYYQIPTVVVVIIQAGSAMFAGDLKGNLTEVFFARPITWRDYLHGKIAALMGLGLSLSAAPCLTLLVCHNLMAGKMSVFYSTVWMVLPIFAFSVVACLTAAAGILACSAWVPSARYSGIVFFMLFVGMYTLGEMLPQLTLNRDFQVLSVPLAVVRIGQEMFGVRRLIYDLPVQWSLCTVCAFIAACYWMAARRIRRAEMA